MKELWKLVYYQTQNPVVWNQSLIQQLDCFLPMDNQADKKYNTEQADNQQTQHTTNSSPKQNG